MSMLNRLVLVAGIALSFAANAHSTAGQSTGVIHFYGALVESPCSYELSAGQISTECYRSGDEKAQTKSVKIEKNMKASLLPDNVGETLVMSLPNDPDKQILTLNYR